MESLPSISSTNQSVVISIPKESFGSFINDLLKTKRSIGRDFDHIYNFTKDNVLDVFHIIDHRITEQHSATLTASEFRATYSDGSHRIYDDIDSFMKINDRMNSYSDGVSLSLSYIVQFSKEGPPIKQDIFFNVTNKKQEESSRFALFSTPIEYGVVSINIRSNSFTWADDIIQHISNYLDSKFPRPGMLAKLISSSKEIYVVLMFPIFICGVVVSEYIGNSGFNGDSKADLLNHALTVDGKNIEGVSEKIDTLINIQLNSGFTPRKIVISLLFFIAVLLLGLIIIAARNLQKGKYVSINEYSVFENSRKERRKRAILATLIGGLILSIGSGLAANYIWSKLFL